METDELDAILLACAGLDRLGWADRITERLPLERFLPAPGQGALAVETRADDTATREAVWRIDHTPTRQSVTAERSFLKHTGGGCHTPVAAWGRLTETGLTLEGLIASPDGRDLARDVVSGNPADAEYLGERLAQKLTMDRNTSRSSS
jgi:hydroxymethylbilane synthase